MKKTVLGLVAALVLSTTAVASAENPFVDVPAGHWAYDYLTQVSQAGIIEGFADKTFKGGNNITRYEAAVMVGRMLAKVDAKFEELKALANTKTGGPVEVKPVLDTATAEKLEKLAAEFKPELANLGVKVDGLSAKLDALEGKIAAADAKIAAVEAKAAELDSKIGNVKLYGEAVAKVEQVLHNSNVTNNPSVAYTELKLKGDAKVAEGVNVGFEFDALKNTFGDAEDDATEKAKEKLARLTIKTANTETVIGNLPATTLSRLSVVNLSGADDWDNTWAKRFNGNVKNTDDLDKIDGILFKAKYGRTDFTALANKWDAGVNPANNKFTGRTHYAGKVAFAMTDTVKASGFGGLLSNTTTFPDDMDKDGSYYYGGDLTYKGARLSAFGEILGYKLSDNYDGKARDNEYGYLAGVSYNLFKGIRIGSNVVYVTKFADWQATMNGINNLRTNLSTGKLLGAKDANKNPLGDEKNVVLFGIGTGGSLTSVDADDYLPLTVALGQKASVEFRGNLIFSRYSDDIEDVLDYPELVTKTTLKMPVFKNTDLEAIYKLNGDKKLTSTNLDEFKLTKSDVEVNLIHTLAKNTTLKVGGELKNIGVDVTGTDTAKAKESKGWAELKVTF